MMHVHKNRRNRPRPRNRPGAPGLAFETWERCRLGEPRSRIQLFNQLLIDLFVDRKTPHHLAQNITLREDLRPSHRTTSQSPEG